MPASSILPRTWGTYGWGYQLLTRGLPRRLREFHLHYIVGNFSIYNPLNGSFLVLPFLFTSSFLQSSGILPNLYDLTRETLRNMLANKKLTPAYADLSFPYAGRPYDKAPT